MKHFLTVGLLPMIHWIKFNVVGVLGFALQSGALFVLTHSGHCVSYLAATVVAVELAVLNNFVWHQRWTWRDRRCVNRYETLRRLAKFNVTNGLMSIVGNLIFMSMLVGHFGLPIVGANLVSVAACSIGNFFLADRIAFTRQKPNRKGGLCHSSLRLPGRSPTVREGFVTQACVYQAEARR